MPGREMPTDLEVRVQHQMGQLQLGAALASSGDRRKPPQYTGYAVL